MYLKSCIPYFRQFACGVGHVINDFNRRLLSSFRLVFLMKVVSMSAASAGWLILYTRFVGALIFRPIVGYLCDNVYIPVLSRKLGKRKSWHLVGSVLTVVAVPLFYTTCLVCSSGSREWQLMVYYCVITTFVMFAVCCIEIAHLSLISVIAQDQKEAVKLNVLRLAFMFMTGVCSYLVALAILGQDSQSKLTPNSSTDFTVMTLIYVGIGLVFAVIFHVGTKEPSEQLVDKRKSRLPLQPTINNPSGNQEKQRMLNWFIESLQSKEKRKSKQLTETNSTADTSRQNLHRCFTDALFPINKEEIDQPVICASKNDEMMLESVKVLPAERKRSLLLSIMDVLEGIDPEVTATYCADGFLPLKDKSNETASLPYSADQVNSTKVETMDDGRVLLAHPERAPQGTEGQKTVRDWLKDPNLYKIAIIYTCTKVLQDISYSYLPLYLTDTLKFEKEAIAYLPLVVLISATVSTGITKKLIGKFGSKWSFILAALDTIGAGVWFYFITEASRMFIYPASVLLGLGFAALYVIAFSFATEVIGHNEGTSGFVFSFLGTIASLAGGSLVMVIQHFFPDGSGTSGECEVCSDYVRRVFSLVPGLLAVVSLMTVLFFKLYQRASKEFPDSSCTKGDQKDGD